MIPSFLDRSKIPHKPGIYQFRDKTGKVIYVGKAIDLYSRVSSYFSGKQLPKTAVMVGEITALDTIIVESELEALILEANLIKKYLPLFNVRLTDDKDYLYIGVTLEDFPKVVAIRRADTKFMKKFWGPFPSSRTVRDTLKQLRKIFPWCSGPPKALASQGQAFRACFYYHLNLCPGACVGLIPKKDYQKIIKNFSKFLDGKKEELVRDLTEQMMEDSNKQRFEDAAKIKKILNGINYITQTNRVSSYLENPNFLEDEKRQALGQLKKDLNLSKLPERIEGYDISNIQGKNATGSMVVLTNGEIDKSRYRKFKIRLSGRPDDVGMMGEMVRRRLNHSEWPLPDLIIVDGGRGQARGVKLEMSRARAGALGNWKLEVPVYGLAKREEWLYPPEGEIIKLSRKSLSLKLLQKLRDEAHRFAITYYRKLHRKSVII